MILLELIISSTKLILMFSTVGAFCMFLVFKLMFGTSTYFYNRGLSFYGSAEGYKDAVRVGSTFKPVFKKIKILPLSDYVVVEGVFGNSLKFKKALPCSSLKHEIFFK